MQNKGAVRFFAIALTIVCVYQLSFTIVTQRVERDANIRCGLTGQGFGRAPHSNRSARINNSRND